MSDIVAFLDVRIAEDEARYGATREGANWRAVTCPVCGRLTNVGEIVGGTHQGRGDSITFTDGHTLRGERSGRFFLEQPLTAMARRWLAECKAKQALIANLMQANVPPAVRMWCLGTMTLPYADHPDYPAVMRDSAPGTSAWSSR